MDSLAGHFLIASPRLGDSNFSKAVVLIVQHNADGALGVVVNRPLETTIAEVCARALETACSTEGVLYQGGPCEGPLMVVHTHSARSDIDVIDGVHFTTDREHLEWLLKYNEAPAKYFVGYAGWGASQLEAELETGSWLTVKASEPQIFADREDLWSQLLKLATLGKWIDLSRIPDDPSVN